MVCALLASGRVHAAVFQCTSGDATCLIAAINTANGNGEDDAIILEAGTYTLTTVDNETDGPNGLPSITSPITLTGAGAETTIIARDPNAPSFRILHIVAAGTLAVHGVTLTGGVAEPDPDLEFADSFGGGLFNAGGGVELLRSRVTDNQATSERDSSGGGIANRGVMTTTDSLIADNFAGAEAGISNGGTLTLLRSTVRGNATGQAAGGGILNGGVLTVADSMISGNLAITDPGGGIANFSETVTVTNSTIAENNVAGEGFGSGGGIATFGGTVTVTNSTIAGNRCSSCIGGGLFNAGGTLELQNTILARNQSGTVEEPEPGPDCLGPVTSLGTNLIGDPSDCDLTLQATDLTGDPGLGNFTDDGTPGDGHFPVLAASRAINAGNDAVCPETDQPGQPRVGICDIGAIEFPQAIVLLNDLVTFDSRRSTFTFTPDPAGCPEGFVGRFRFEARLTNTSDRSLADLFVEVTTLTQGNLLQNADGGPGGVGARLTVPRDDAFADGVLSPEEFVDVPFILCLQERRPFQFFVDAFGVVDASADARAKAQLVTDRRARAWAGPHE